MNQKSPSQARGLRLGVIVGGILLVAVVAAAIANSLRPVELLDSGTPEGLVQAFLVAVEGEQYERARDLLSAGARADCGEADLAFDQSNWSRVVVDDVTEFDGETQVILLATVTEVDPLDSYTYETTLEFTLVSENGALRIDDLPYPYFCRNN